MMICSQNIDAYRPMKLHKTQQAQHCSTAASSALQAQHCKLSTASSAETISSRLEMLPVILTDYRKK